MSQDLSSSPLPACPDTPNCIHQVHSFDVTASPLARLAVEVLEDMGAESVQVGEVDPHEIKAVFKVWRFRDDVLVLVEPGQHGSTLFIRSASREGEWDLGVNRRRVRKFIQKLNDAVKSAG